MENLIKAVAEKYGGSYSVEEDKIVHSSDATLNYQYSHTLFELNNYKISVFSYEDGHTGLPYKVIVNLRESSTKKLVLYPRSYLGKIIRKFGYESIRNKYWTNFSKQFFNSVSQDFKLESLLMSHNVSILSKLEKNQSRLIISPIESVLDLKTIDEIIDIAVRLAKIADDH